jgi:hypothetical protein
MIRMIRCLENQKRLIFLKQERWLLSKFLFKFKRWKIRVLQGIRLIQMWLTWGHDRVFPSHWYRYPRLYNTRYKCKICHSLVVSLCTSPCQGTSHCFSSMQIMLTPLQCRIHYRCQGHVPLQNFIHKHIAEIVLRLFPKFHQLCVTSISGH